MSVKQFNNIDTITFQIQRYNTNTQLNYEMVISVN